MQKISVIIRAFNEEAHIGRLLEGIARQTVPDPEVVLVDSGSTDATAAIARRFGARVVEIRPEEFTFGRSLNRGLEASTGEIAVIASAHVYPIYPDWLERLTAPFSEPAVALTYGKQRGAATSRFSEHQVFARWFPETSNPRQGHPFCNNANAAIRRSLWAEHPYDETLPGLEDVAWAKWAIDQGHTLAYVAEAEVIHLHDEAPRQVYNRYRREGMAFKAIYDEAHFSLYDFIRMTWANTIADLQQAAASGLFWKRGAEVIWFRAAQFWGTYRGYRQAQNPLTAPLRQTFYYPGGRGNVSISREIEPIWYNQEDRGDQAEQ